MFESWIDGQKLISKENTTPEKREGEIKVCAGNNDNPVLGKMANFFITTKQKTKIQKMQPTSNTFYHIEVQRIKDKPSIPVFEIKQAWVGL